MNSILNLSTLLRKHYDHKVIVLIDEYDVPLDKAFQHGYYNEMVGLIRNMFIQALKGNDSLYFSVLTGCLRVSKESIFTGLNNPKIFSITTVRFDEYFGFTDNEVRLLLDDLVKWMFIVLGMSLVFAMIYGIILRQILKNTGHIPVITTS